MRNSKVSGKEIVKAKPSYVDMKTAKYIGEQRASRHHELRKELSGIDEMIAEDKTFFANWMYPEAETAFPENKRLWFVDRYYPYAKDGPLLVDHVNLLEPCEDEEAMITRGNAEIKEEFAQKAAFLRKHGYRYLMLTPDMTMDEAFQQASGKPDADISEDEQNEEDEAATA